MLAFTGLETVANLAEEARRPGVDLPRSVFGGDRDRRDDLRRDRASSRVSAFPGPNTELGTRWIRAPLARRRRPARRASCRAGSATSLRIYVGLTGALILLAAVTTSISGFSRLAYSLGEHGQLPRSFGRLSRRAHVSPHAIFAAALDLVAIVIGTSFLQARRRVPREPLLVRRAARVHRGAARGDQAADRRAGPAAALPRAVQRPHPRRRHPAAGDRRRRSRRSRSGSSRSRRIRPRATPARSGSRSGSSSSSPCAPSHGEGLMEQVIGARRAARSSRRSRFRRILVPMKLGIIGEEMLATAIKLAERARRGGRRRST